MKVSDKLGINPDVWKEKSLEEFKELCKGFITPEQAKEKWTEFKKLYPSKKKPVKVKEEKEGGE
jgi:hypothetical protein